MSREMNLARYLDGGNLGILQESYTPDATCTVTGKCADSLQNGAGGIKRGDCIEGDESCKMFALVTRTNGELVRTFAKG